MDKFEAATSMLYVQDAEMGSDSDLNEDDLKAMEQDGGVVVHSDSQPMSEESVEITALPPRTPQAPRASAWAVTNEASPESDRAEGAKAPGNKPDIRHLLMASSRRPSTSSGTPAMVPAAHPGDDEPVCIASTAAAPPAPESAPAPGGVGAGGGVLAAFNLSVSTVDGNVLDSEALLAPPPRGASATDEAMEGGDLHLERLVLAQPAQISGFRDAVPILVADAPLLPSGQAIFAQLPQETWVALSGRSDALGARSLFAARRHEHSVFAHVAPNRLLQVPQAARAWQPVLQVPEGAQEFAKLAEEEAWAVEVLPGRRELRVLARPGVLLSRMMRGGTALPSARFSWRVSDASEETDGVSRGASGVVLVGDRRPPGFAIGEFSILSNVEDAAHTQPPRFEEFPLRREQLRSLGWMVSQERRRREPFVTELREAAPCADAPHWHLEGRLSCEYADVKGGVLADAIGYGKTACTIGLVDCFRGDPIPRVPPAYGGFIPTKATLILAPTNLHAQWLGEIRKFTGETMKVLSVPTCAQLKRLTPAELMSADIVVATYRLFYSTAYLRRLEELAQEQIPDFAFPRQPHGKDAAVANGSKQKSARKLTEDWARAYRRAFETLPEWAQKLHGGAAAVAADAEALSTAKDPVTPARQRRVAAGGTPETTAAPVAPGRRRRGKSAPDLGSQPAATQESSVQEGEEDEEATQPMMATPSSQAPESVAAKRRRLSHKKATPGGPASPRKSRGQKSSQWFHEAHYVPLEAFWWRRLVCDEFHELLGRYPPAQVAVQLFHADYKWGLSGTPPCQTLAQIRKAAGFFGVQIPNTIGENDGGEAPRQVAQEWLDAFVRRNTAELAPLEEEERIVPVQQTEKERALYLALTQHQKQLASEATQAVSSESAGVEEPPEIQAARHSASGLLKLCSHFCASGAADVLTAEDECERQLALRRERVRAVEREMLSLADRAVSTAQLVRHFEPHFCAAPDADRLSELLLAEPRASIVNRLKFLGVPASLGTKKELVNRLLETISKDAEEAPGEAVKEMVLRPDFNLKTAGLAADLSGKTPTWAKLEPLVRQPLSGDSKGSVGSNTLLKSLHDAVSKAATHVKAGAPPRASRLRSSLGMERWVTPKSEAVDASGKIGDAAAAVLQRGGLSEEDWCWLADEKNAEQLRKVTDAWKADLERSSARLLQLKDEVTSRALDVDMFNDSLQASQAVTPACAEECPEPAPAAAARFAKYGSKIQALVAHVKKVQKQDPGCRIICFVQWEDLKKKISAALEEFEVEHLTLHGSVWARRTALMKFQYEADSPRILLLSLQESASGTNLTSANHVIIVHPMEAATREEAVAFEMQAVGRVRRPGQQRKIFIWRFVTMGTIEQQITEEHQQELWERQRAQILVPAVDLDAVPEESESEEEQAQGAQDASTQRYPEAQQACDSGLAAPSSPAVLELDASTQRYEEEGDHVEADTLAYGAPTGASLDVPAKLHSSDGRGGAARDAEAMPPPPVPAVRKRKAVEFASSEAAEDAEDVEATQRYAAE